MHSEHTQEAPAYVWDANTPEKICYQFDLQIGEGASASRYSIIYQHLKKLGLASRPLKWLK